MKIYRVFLMMVAAATLAVVGCKKGGSVDTSNMEKSFASADAAAKSSAEKAVTAIKSVDYVGAFVELKILGEKAKLILEQQQAIKDVMARLQQLVADTASKAAGDASKAAGDLQKSLKK